ncbi:SCP2 sterol-binding domain-containing protein [Zhongshania guokunii]|uniref:SCP2 sterol-binding domain-containing protein n=1 Tax=Zhongshania guokunii TaxID=641783 RepID=A0ABV3UAG3_9GAMM
MNDFFSAMQILDDKVSNVPAFGKKVRFVLDDNSAILNGNLTPPKVELEDSDAEIVFKSTLVNFNKLMSKELNATTAFMSGKIKIEGDLKSALPLMKIL